MVTEARKTAFELLLAVERDGVYPNIKLPKMLANSEMNKQDRGLTQELSYGTLRMQLLYDALIDFVTDKQDLNLEVRLALRLGLHELINMRTGDHAAVDQYVELIKTQLPKASGLVNAVLRRISRDKDELISAVTDGGKDLAISFAHPRWIVDALSSSREMDNAGEVSSLLAENNVSPKPQMIALPPNPLPQGAKTLELSKLGFEHIEGLDNSVYRFQDQGSQLVTQIAADAAPNGNWLDMCAGPGGKASLLAAIATQRDSHLTAIELYPQRANLVRQALEGFSNVEVHAADATEFKYSKKYQLVLIDAPCTGLGALRRKPESRNNKQPTDVQELNKIQKRLLKIAASVTDSGGVIAYITCSPVIEETTAIARWFLDSYEEFEILPWFDYANIEANRSRKTLQLWSDKHNSDCMFLALFKKS